jgi:hypothetical protein
VTPFCRIRITARQPKNKFNSVNRLGITFIREI